jgi:DNA-binding NtrC family response regulator
MSRVLVVDDERALRDALRRLFGDKWPEHQYDTVASGWEALEILKTHRFGLVIADLHRPGEDGLEFLSAALRIQPDLVFVVLTGYGRLEDAREAMRRGAFAYMTKPYRTDEFSIVEEALALAHCRETGESEERFGFLVNGIFYKNR